MADQERFILAIDVLNSCNLRCPSCPVGNMGRKKTTSAILTAGKFAEILAKLKREIRESNLVVWLYNWSEPLLHPEIDRLISVAKEWCSWVGISSNLNIANADVILNTLLAGPSTFKVSLSGFTAQSYAAGHAGGNLELVKRNLEIVKKHVDTFISRKTDIWVGYHIYNDNTGDEYREACGFCSELGFRLDAYPAYASPIEKVIDILEGKSVPEIERVVQRLLLKPRDWADAIGGAPGTDGCFWRDKILTLDADCNVDLCCRTYATSLNVNYLDTSLDEVRRLQKSHPLCRRCQSFGAHRFGELALAPELKKRVDAALGVTTEQA